MAPRGRDLAGLWEAELRLPSASDRPTRFLRSETVKSDGPSRASGRVCARPAHSSRPAPPSTSARSAPGGPGCWSPTSRHVLDQESTNPSLCLLDRSHTILILWMKELGFSKVNAFTATESSSPSSKSRSLSPRHS